MINFNDPAHNQDRIDNKTPDDYQIIDVIDFIKSLLKEVHFFKQNDLSKLQSLLYDYENLRHYRARTEGLFATDQPELFHSNSAELVELKFGK